MPTIHYSSEEYAALLYRATKAEADLKTQKELLEQLQPVWSVGCQTAIYALSQLWGILGAKTQTEAVNILRQWERK